MSREYLMGSIENNSNKGRIFALEGLDGVGKSSVGKALSGEVDASYLYCTDGCKLKKMRWFFDDKSIPIRFLYYCGLSMETRSKAKKLTNFGDVFIDRYLPSTIAYHKALGLSDKFINLIPRSVADEISAMIYLRVNEDERLRRLEDRGINKSDKASIELANRIEEEYLKLMPERTIIIDNSGTISETVNQIKAKIYG